MAAEKVQAVAVRRAYAVQPAALFGASAARWPGQHAQHILHATTSNNTHRHHHDDGIRIAGRGEAAQSGEGDPAWLPASRVWCERCKVVKLPLVRRRKALHSLIAMSWVAPERAAHGACPTLPWHVAPCHARPTASACLMACMPCPVAEARASLATACPPLPARSLYGPTQSRSVRRAPPGTCAPCSCR